MKTTTHGLRSFSYLGAELFDDLFKEIPYICDLPTEFTEYEMKNLIKLNAGKGPWLITHMYDLGWEEQ